VYADDTVFNDRRVNRKESIPWDKMQEIIGDMEEMGVKAVTFSGGGEPLCYHSIIPTLQRIKESGIDYSLITNGQELFGEKADLLCDAKWVRISMDAANAETYQKIRQVGTYDKVIHNLSDFAAKKSSHCTLGINFVVMQDNFGDIYDFCRKMQGIGVNNIKFSPLMVKEDIPEYHQAIQKEVEDQLKAAKKELVKTDFEIIDKYSNDMLLDENFEKQYHICYMKELFTVIAADQKVYFCHQKAYRPEGVIGDIQNTSFKELWFSDKTTKIFQSLDAKRDCGFRCAFEERNILLNQLLELDENHINFI